MVNINQFISSIKDRKREIKDSKSKIYNTLSSRIKQDDLLAIYNYITENQKILKTLNEKDCIRFAKEDTRLSRTFNVVKQEDGELALILETKRKAINENGEEYKSLSTFKKRTGASKTCKESWRIDTSIPIAYVTLVLDFHDNVSKRLEEAKREVQISRSVDSEFIVKDYMGEIYKKPTYKSPYIVDITDYTKDKLGIFQGVEKNDSLEDIDIKISENTEYHEVGELAPLVIRFKDQKDNFLYAVQSRAHFLEIIDDKHKRYSEIHEVCSGKLDFSVNQDKLPATRSSLTEADDSLLFYETYDRERPKITTKVNIFCKKADGSLSGLLMNIRNGGIHLTVTQKDRILKDILLGLHAMHSNNISHGDAGPQNIFIYKENNGEYRAKLGDFGLSKENCSEVHKNTDIWRISQIMQNLYTKEELDEKLQFFNLGPLSMDFDENTQIRMNFLKQYQQSVLEGPKQKIQKSEEESASSESFESNGSQKSLIVRLRANYDESPQATGVNNKLNFDKDKSLYASGEGGLSRDSSKNSSEVHAKYKLFVDPATTESPRVKRDYNQLAESSCLSALQIKSIYMLIDKLTEEIQSCWPFPNKDRKQNKIDGLKKLLQLCNKREIDISMAIESVKTDPLYPYLTIGTRTKDLLADLSVGNQQKDLST